MDRKKKYIEQLKKGNGEIIMFASCIIPIMMMFMLATHCLQLSHVFSELNKAALVSGRASAICTKREDADEQSLRVAQSCITEPYISDIQTEINIVDNGRFGEGLDWGMGQIIKMTVSAKAETIARQLSGKRYQRSVLVPVEGGGAYLGLWRLTAYCPCAICNGSNVGSPTASGRWYTPNKTIAMAKTTKERYGFEWGDRFLIRGHIYTLEDGGDSNMAANNNGKCIDIFVSTHPECYQDQYNGMAEVFYVGHE